MPSKANAKTLQNKRKFTVQILFCKIRQTNAIAQTKVYTDLMQNAKTSTIENTRRMQSKTTKNKLRIAHYSIAF